MSLRRGVAACLWSGLVLTVLLGVSGGLWALLAAVGDPVAAAMKVLTLLAAVGWVIDLVVLVVCLALFVLTLEHGESGRSTQDAPCPDRPVGSPHEASPDDETA